MSSSVFDWRAGGSSLIYQELAKRGNRDGTTRRIRELEALEKTGREAKQTPRCDVFTSKSLAHWPQRGGPAREAGERAPSDQTD